MGAAAVKQAIAASNPKAFLTLENTRVLAMLHPHGRDFPVNLAMIPSRSNCFAHVPIDYFSPELLAAVACIFSSEIRSTGQQQRSMNIHQLSRHMAQG